jgi:hypothetical protein
MPTAGEWGIQVRPRNVWQGNVRKEFLHSPANHSPAFSCQLFPCAEGNKPSLTGRLPAGRRTRRIRRTSTGFCSSRENSSRGNRRRCPGRGPRPGPCKGQRPNTEAPGRTLPTAAINQSAARARRGIPARATWPPQPATPSQATAGGSPGDPQKNPRDPRFLILRPKSRRPPKSSAR